MAAPVISRHAHGVENARRDRRLRASVSSERTRVPRSAATVNPDARAAARRRHIDVRIRPAAVRCLCCRYESRTCRPGPLWRAGLDRIRHVVVVDPLVGDRPWLQTVTRVGYSHARGGRRPHVLREEPDGPAKDCRKRITPGLSAIHVDAYAPCVASRVCRAHGSRLVGEIHVGGHVHAGGLSPDAVRQRHLPGRGTRGSGWRPIRPAIRVKGQRDRAGQGPGVGGVLGLLDDPPTSRRSQRQTSGTR